MAQIYTDFSDYDNDSDLYTEWEPRGRSTTSSFTLTNDSQADGGVRLDFTGQGSSGVALIWKEHGSAEDQEIVAKMRMPVSSNNNVPRNFFRVTNDPFDNDSYWIRQHTGNVILGGYIDGSFTTFGDTSYDLLDDVWYIFRVRAEGNTLSGKVWQADNPEPSNWLIESVDSSHTSGEFGIGSWNRDTLFNTDFVGVGTDGDTAPMEPVVSSNSPLAPTNLTALEL